jgi:hypothetical protein
MNSTEDIIEDNARENEHLKKLVGRITDKDMDVPLEAGWTVSALLAHLAFWDLRVITLIGKWENEGVGPSPIDTDVVNEATRSLCLAIPPRTAAELAVAVADRVDEVIANLTPEMAQAILTEGTKVKLSRADHRRTHLGAIEKVLPGR